MESSNFLDILETLEFDNKSNIMMQLKTFICQIKDHLQLEWLALRIIPQHPAAGYTIPEFNFCTNKKLNQAFSPAHPKYHKTLLARIEKARWMKNGSYRLSPSCPEYSPSLYYFTYKFNFPEVIFIIETAVKRKNEFNFHLIHRFIHVLKRKLDKEKQEKDHAKRVDDLLNLIEISKLLNSTMYLKNLLNKLFAEVKQIMMAEGCSLILVDKETGALKFQTVKGKKSQIIKEVIIPANKGFAGWIVKNRKPLIVNDVEKDRRFYRNVDLKSGFRTRNLLGVPLIVNDELIGIIEAVNKKRNEPFTRSDLELFSALANQAAIAIQNAQYYEKLNELFLSTVKSLSAAIEAKDKYTRGHTERVTKYSVLLAKELNFNSEEMKRVELAGLLHDIGKIGINEKILTKPGHLTDEEYQIIKQHSEIGEGIMAPIRELKDILPGIRNHHERWDGKGYPDRLKKKRIPILGRIIALADTYDAMTSDRPYRKGVKLQTAVKEIQKCSGSQFDPKLTDVFIKIISKMGKRG